MFVVGCGHSEAAGRAAEGAGGEEGREEGELIHSLALAFQELNMARGLVAFLKGNYE